MITWADLLKSMRRAGWDDDEYCKLAFDQKPNPTQPIWDGDTCNVAVWATPDSNEGYHVVIERITDEHRSTRIIAKFWTFDRALACVDWTTRVIHHDH